MVQRTRQSSETENSDYHPRGCHLYLERQQMKRLRKIKEVSCKVSRDVNICPIESSITNPEDHKIAKQGKENFLQGRPSRSRGSIRKQTNAREDLDDSSSLLPESASGDYSVSQLELWDELQLYYELLALKNSCDDVLTREMETKDAGTHKEICKIKKVVSQLEQKEMEWEKLCNMRLEIECLMLEGQVKRHTEEIEEIQKKLTSGSLTEDEKKQLNKLAQITQSLACILNQEKEKTEELEKELLGFMKVLDLTGKKLCECENTEFCFHEGVNNRKIEMLKHELNFLKETWESVHCRYLHQDINIQLTEQELLAIRTAQYNCESLHQNQENIGKEVVSLKTLFQENMTQLAEEKNLQKLRESNDASRISQMILRIQSLESQLPVIQSQMESTRTEMEKYKQLCIEASETRKSLSFRLKQTKERLTVVKSKLRLVHQQNRTLENSPSSMSLRECPPVARLNPAVERDPFLPTRSPTVSYLRPSAFM